ncbi:hypothetical protein EniLVp02_0108 [Vibrio phage EniLVp02]
MHSKRRKPKMDTPIPFPYKNLSQLTTGVRVGELVVMCSGEKVGRSTMLIQGDQNEARQ